MSQNQSQNGSYDPTLARGYLLINLAGAIEQVQDTAARGILLRYMECIIQEQEKITGDFVSTKRIIH